MKKNILRFMIFFGASLLAFDSKIKAQEKERNPVIIKMSGYVVATMEIKTVSIHDVIATITVRNISNKRFLLYKRSLPSDSSVYRHFNVTLRNHSALRSPHLKRSSNELTSALPTIDYPELLPTNFALLESGKSMSFSANLAKTYNFSKGVEYYCAYSTFLPVVENNMKQVVEPDPDDHDKLKPVYVLVSVGDFNSRMKFVIK